MPEEEGSGVNGAGSPSAQQGVNNEGSPTSQQGVNGAGSPTVEPEISPRANERIQQLVRERDGERARAAANEALARQLATQHNDLMQRMSQQQQNAQPTVDPETAALETVVNQNLGGDATGQQARQTIEALIKLNVNKALKGVNTGGVTREEIAQIVQSTVSQAMAPQAINGTLQQMVTDKVITSADVSTIAQEMQTLIAAEPAWGRGENVALLPDVVLGRLVRSGKIKANQPVADPARPGGTPLQPGGTGTGEVDDKSITDIAQAAIDRFPALKGRKSGDLAKKWGKQEFNPQHGETIFAGRT